MDNFNLGLHETLKTRSEDWNFNTDGDPEKLSRKMIDFMLSNQGIGLAANQVNIAKRVFVMGHPTNLEFPRPFALFNPSILEVSDRLILDQEGCLSYPGIRLHIKRPSWIIAEYTDEKGDSKEIRLEGYAAKCFQHEYDHLDGVCFVDRVSAMKLKLAIKKSRKYK
jgi:peptide deformylase